MRTDSSTYTAGEGVKATSNPGLGPLQDNGGPTLTHALLSGSAALNAGDPMTSGGPETDQRLLARVLGGRVDIGAVEMAGVLPPTGAQTGGWVAVAGLGVLLGAALVFVRMRFTRARA